MIEVVGIDWSGAQDAGRRAWVCRAVGTGPKLRVLDVHRVADKAGPALDDVLAYVRSVIVGPSGERWIGLDFPFSITRMVSEHLGYGKWQDLVSSWETLFPDAVTFARACTKASIESTGAKEGKRMTDRAAGAPMSAWNLRLFRQTYHGVRLLRRLLRNERVAILPWGQCDRCEVRLVEICPAATLATAGEKSLGYKGRCCTHAERRKHLLGLAGDEWGVSISRASADVIIGDRGGDALDAVLAAVSAYHHAALLSADQHEAIRSRADLLEGYIYVAGGGGARNRSGQHRQGASMMR
jgi:hypothetical protein